MWRRAVESSSRFTKADVNFSAENIGNWCYVVALLPCYSKEADLKQNDSIMQLMKVGLIAFIIANS